MQLILHTLTDIYLFGKHFQEKRSEKWAAELEIMYLRIMIDLLLIPFMLHIMTTVTLSGINRK